MENILVVPTVKLSPFLQRSGLQIESPSAVIQIIRDNLTFLPRPEAEKNPEYKQIISYVSILRGSEIFATRRLRKGGESRLHGLWSIGIGGHINAEQDRRESDILHAGMLRELHEEVRLSHFSSPQFHGVINDDSNEVGRVHLGLFYTLHTDEDVSVRETEKLEGSWMPLDALAPQAEQFETWSQLLFPFLSQHNL